MEWSLSVTNLPLRLRDWLKKGLFHQLTLSCALTLSDNRLLDLFMVLFPDWTQQPSRCWPYWLSRCRAAKGNEKRPFRVTTLDVMLAIFFLPELSNHNTSHFMHKGANTSPQHFSNLLLWEGKYTKTLAAHLSKPGTNGLPLMASKVNREVCQLKVNGCLLNTSACFHFTRKRRKGKWQPRRCFILFCSLGGSRGQDLIGLLSYQSVFDKSWMEPVLFVFCSGWDSSPFVWHVSVEWMQLVFV